jgi:hypothetical protein
LWHVGFLTAQPAGQAAPGRASAQTFHGTQRNQYLNLARSQRFQVHPMFRAYLDITRPPRR